MHAILTSFGSTGDLLPLLSIGQGMAERGNRVTVAAGEGFRKLVEGHGFDFVPICGAEEYERSIREIGVLASRYRGLFFRKYVVGWNAGLLRFLAEEGREDSIYISAERPTLWADLCAHAHFRMPCVRLAIDLPASAKPTAGLPAGIGGMIQQDLSETWQYDWRSAARGVGVNAGPRHTERLARATSASVPRLALWPEWFAPGIARLLPRIGFVGTSRAWPIAESEELRAKAPGESALRPQLSALSNGGARPRLIFVAGSLGTTATWEKQFVSTSRMVCERLGCDGLVLGGSGELEAEGTDRLAHARRYLPINFDWKKYVPLESVLVGAAAIVHHGGIGTTAAALRAGVPQLIVPRMFGQSANATCARKLGVATVMAPEAYGVASATTAISGLLNDAGYRERSRQLGAKIDLDRDRRRVCDFIESWYAKSGATRANWVSPRKLQGAELAA